MPINVSEAIDSQTGEPIKILRKSHGNYVKGLWVPGSIKQIKALASVQIVKPEEISLFTGLERVKDIKTFIVNKPVRATDQYENEEADLILWKTKIYKTMKSKDWESYGYNIVLGAREE